MPIKSVVAIAMSTLLMLVTARAQEITLRAVTFVNEGSYYARNFERFIEMT